MDSVLFPVPRTVDLQTAVKERCAHRRLLRPVSVDDLVLLLHVPIAAVFYVAFRVDLKLPAKELRRLLKLGLASVGVALVFVLPFLIPYYLATHGGVVDYRDAGESQAFAAALADYIIPHTSHFLGDPQLVGCGALARTGCGNRNGNCTLAPSRYC